MPRKKTSPTLANLKYYFDLKHYVDQNQLTTEDAEALSTRLHHEKIQELIDTNLISVETALGLRDRQWEALISDDSIRQRFIKGELNIAFVGYPFLQYDVNKNKLTLKQAETLVTEFDNQKIATWDAWKISSRLDNENARKLIFANITSLETFTDLRSSQWDALKNDSIRDRFIKGELNIAFVDCDFLQDYVNQNKLTREQAETLSTEFYNQEIDFSDAWEISRLLYCENFRKLIFDNVTSLETFTDLRSSQWEALDDDSIRERVITGELNIAFVDCPFFQDFVNQDKLTLEQAKGILNRCVYNEGRDRGFVKTEVISLVKTGVISVETALDLRDSQWEALYDDSIRQRFIKGELNIAFVDYSILQDYVHQEILTFKQAETLVTEFYNQKIYRWPWIAENISMWLSNENARKVIFANITSLKKFCYLRSSEWDALDDDSIRDRVISGELNINFVECPILQLAVDDNRVDLNDAIRISRSERTTSDKIQRLIYYGILSLDQYNRLASHHYDLIKNNDDHYQWLLERTITIDDILQLGPGEVINIAQHEERLRAGVNELQNEPLNDRQSTHTSSVHRSVSASAERLMDSYRDKIEGGKLEKVISDLKNYVSSLDDESQIT